MNLYSKKNLLDFLRNNRKLLFPCEEMWFFGHTINKYFVIYYKGESNNRIYNIAKHDGIFALDSSLCGCEDCVDDIKKDFHPLRSCPFVLRKNIG